MELITKTVHPRGTGVDRYRSMPTPLQSRGGEAAGTSITCT
jgi:hypothetical protein